jgi:hypothetical protein
MHQAMLEALPSLLVGANNVVSVAAKKDPEAMGGVLASRINNSMYCQWGQFLVT